MESQMTPLARAMLKDAAAEHIDQLVREALIQAIRNLDEPNMLADAVGFVLQGIARLSKEEQFGLMHEALTARVKEQAETLLRTIGESE